MKLIPYKQHNHIGYCVYFLYNKNKIVYIGYTFNLGRRLGEHSQWSNVREGYGTQLVKKQFTHYRYIPINNGKRARLLESILIKKHNPKYNNHSDYHWVSTGKKYIFYKQTRSFGTIKTEPEEITYTTMDWVKRKGKKINTIKYKKKGVTWYYDKRRKIHRNYDTKIFYNKLKEYRA